MLRRVQTQGAFASAALRARLAELDERDRGLATELVYGVLRRRGQLDRSLAGKGKRFKDIDPKLQDVLRIAAYQLMFLDRVPDHAAVDAAVEQARSRRGERGAKMANAVLRKLADKAPQARLRPAPPFAQDPVAHVAAAGSVPHAMAERLVADLGKDAALTMVLANLEVAPLVLRVNQLKSTRDALIEEVGGSAGGHALAVHLPSSSGLPAELKAVTEGRATVQDEASMHVVDMLDPQPGESVFDVCAAPGGKTTAIAERMEDEGRVVAHDRAIDKLRHVRAAAERLGLQSIETAEVHPESLFDRVLVDAPCSGLGTLRRHPEIRWRWRPDDTEELARKQRRIIRDAALRVRPGGSLVYSVCTVLKAEAEAIVEGVDGFELVETKRFGPDQDGAPDGFFAARLIREG